MLKFLNALLVAGAMATVIAAPVHAQDTAVKTIVGDTKFELVAHWDVAKLNAILTSDTPKFSGINVPYTPARTGVNLYRITYSTVVPEKGNKPTRASGLLALPDTQDTTLPLVSYQHGTVYGRQEVPSFAEQSPETQLMIAQFAGQGYALIGADYFGLGVSTEPEGYLVKASQQQACFDLLTASKGVLASLGRKTDKLYLAGWSQGGFVTMALLEKLEKTGIPVNGAATASAPLDLGIAMSGFLNFPRSYDAVWLNSIFILSAFSYENYYGVPGLARSVLNDAYYDVAKKAYDRPAGPPVNPADIPTDLHKLLKPDYFNPQYFADSAFGKLIAETQSYRWVIKSPVRNYYGDTDEAITVGVGRLAQTYAQALGAGNKAVEAISTGPTTHRGTFATAVPQWKSWFDGR
ncbi:alpha/beta hydrolase [Variovorax ginsengisoli]|uniref:Pimeloyl-ACP methyl ester carboxylesterase n=1 Tax=Variovorax ginsengisoli TaxID=363844 RepID=A0ABT9S1E2_9BURK|nr:alpha/beta hydrolase [Variovorax ginsengisoli]MDP9898166.1 pimeloyl-ACP methyl ester carboxylesterase [Variovorax ginsengisoli]